MLGPIRIPAVGSIERKLALLGVGLVATSALLVWHARSSRFPVPGTMAVLDRPRPLEVAFSGDSRLLAVRYENEVIHYRVDGKALEAGGTLPFDASYPAKLMASHLSINLLTAEEGDRIKLVDITTGRTSVTKKIWFHSRELVGFSDCLVHAWGVDPKSGAWAFMLLRVEGNAMHGLADDRFWARFASANDLIVGLPGAGKSGFVEGSWRVLADDFVTELKDALAPHDQVIGFIDNETWNGILVFTFHCHLLRLFAPTGEEVHHWKVDPRLNFLAALDECGTLAGYSNDPDTVWLGTISSLPSLSPLAVLDSGADPDHFEVCVASGVFWANLGPGLPIRKLPLAGDLSFFVDPFKVPSQVVFFRPDANKSPLGYFLSDDYLMTRVSPCGRFAALAFGGKKGKVVLLDLTRAE